VTGSGPAAGPRLDAGTLGDDRTIAAIATPPGRGALAIVRLSGRDVLSVAARILDPAPTEPRTARLARVMDPDDGTVLDEVVAIWYAAPRSFTGEDLLEINTHGGLHVPTSVLAAAIRAGARDAAPGEFTRRAVLNGKLDLLQAEAIGDLVDARSSAAQRQALRQLDGGLSARVQALRERILAIESLLAYDIDFPEEDDGPVPRQRVAQAADELQQALAALLATGEQGTLVHEGALVVLAGAPNVGKSSLFNALLGEARAIVTDVPGTTRDAIEAVLDLPRWPLRLVDTAGLRETTDEVERLGIEVSSRYAGQAAVVIACGDSAESIASAMDVVRERSSAPVVRALTKADMAGVSTDANVRGADVAVSAHTGVGLHRLLELVEARITDTHGEPTPDQPALVHARHRAAVARAADELRAFAESWREDALPATVAVTHVRAASDALGELIGDVRVDDVLDVVFRRFCVGK
jgi:tRNA modification GTPase